VNDAANSVDNALSVVNCPATTCPEKSLTQPRGGVAQSPSTPEKEYVIGPACDVCAVPSTTKNETATTTAEQCTLFIADSRFSASNDADPAGMRERVFYFVVESLSNVGVRSSSWNHARTLTRRAYDLEFSTDSARVATTN
jgi:hypothetical protein